MRVALVSPYSYTYPGGVGRHVEALAQELMELGHEVRLLAPYDPDDRIARVTHRGARPQRRPLPDHVVPMGRTLGLPMNGAVSNLATFPKSVGLLGRELRHGGYDVVHVHEPNAPYLSWYATEAAQGPVVATFHTYSTSGLANRFAASFIGARRLYAKLSARIAVSEAAQWTAQRYYGGRYRIVPNGVDLSAAPAGRLAPARGRSGSSSWAAPRSARACPCCCARSRRCAASACPARLTVAGPTAEEVEPLLLDPEGIEIAGQVDDATKWKLLGEADILCAPSLGGESFGMVLTEAFASGTPVVASDIAGYREVVQNGRDGVLVPVGDAVALGETLLELASDPERRTADVEAALERAERFAWPNVAREVESVYEEALGVPEPDGRVARVAQRLGAVPTEPGPRQGPQRLPSLEPKAPAARGRKVARTARRVLIVAGAVAGAGLAALALQRIGVESIGRAVVAATPVWVLVAFALMCASMLVRAEAWHAILRAALPGTRVRRRDAARATMIGVLMSATLPARLGEPSRALIMARRVGRVRDRFPIVLGTLVSQTLLNILALLVLGAVMFHTVGLFKGNEQALIIVTIAPGGAARAGPLRRPGCSGAASRRGSSASSRPPRSRAARCCACAPGSRSSASPGSAPGRSSCS